jgi:endonuclease YncB( thermonuclease family)
VTDPKPFAYYAEIVRWVDGDTVDCRVDLGFKIYTRNRFRLEKIDAWESRGSERELGKLATARAQELAPVGSRVLLTTAKAGKYGRWLAMIYPLDENGVALQSVNDTLVEEGHAVPYGEK